MLAFGPSAHAAEYLVSFSGAISAINSVRDGVVTLGSPGGDVAVGDAFNLDYRFQTDGLLPDSLFDADPSINIYVGVPIRDLNVSIAHGYRLRAASAFSTLQLWDDHTVEASLPTVDSFSASLLAFAAVGQAIPFDMGTGQVSQHINLSAFDFDGTARTSDLITEVTPFSGFDDRIISLGFRNVDTGYYIDVQTSISAATITEVPEPSAWVLMVAGFGCAGWMLRSSVAGARRRETHVRHVS